MTITEKLESLFAGYKEAEGWETYLWIAGAVGALGTYFLYPPAYVFIIPAVFAVKAGFAKFEEKRAKAIEEALHEEVENE